MAIFSSLKMRLIWWILSAMAIGMLATAMWMQSITAWERHLNNAYISGLRLYHSLQTNAPAGEGLILTRLSGQDSTLADAGMFTKLPEVLASDYITRLSINTGDSDGRANRMDIAIVASALQYPIAKLKGSENKPTGAGLAELTRLLASYCTEPIVFARFEQGYWHKINGNAIWGCDAAPLDLRLPALLIAVVGLMILFTLAISTTGTFQSFAQMLANQGVRRGTTRYEREGPEELGMIIDAINDYLEGQQRSLSKRAMFLSGVSHDLGTPATRLRLRAEAIKDETLRLKINGDIDHMTGMIMSVLTYTQTEINDEPPRTISLFSLVDSVVADYQDANQNVTLTETDLPKVTGRTILFSGGEGSELPKKQTPSPQIVITAQPLALKRALSNLIDNALKYGRKAMVSVEANSVEAHIHIDDFGTGIEPAEIQRLTSPFQRGKNIGQVKGSGIGLAITTTIAEQHGGRLEFLKGQFGIRATLTLPR
jgi:signal transduction histidine kinase